jgi:hypothetical protein
VVIRPSGHGIDIAVMKLIALVFLLLNGKIVFKGYRGEF